MFGAELDQHRETVARLGNRAAEARDVLAPGTRAKLESRRAELEALPVGDALALIELTRVDSSWNWSEDPWAEDEGTTTE